jgi:hypothetical protein
MSWFDEVAGLQGYQATFPVTGNDPGAPNPDLSGMGFPALAFLNQLKGGSQDDLASITSWLQSALSGIGQSPQQQSGATATAGGAPTAAAATTVPAIFPTQYYQPGDLTQTFKAVPGEWGNDYAMPVGQPISTPFGGIVHFETDENKWGRRAIVELLGANGQPTGWSFAVGHLSEFDPNLHDGDKIKAGTQIGLSGGAVSDPLHGGGSTATYAAEGGGPHVEVMFINPAGSPVDPAPILQAIYSGQSPTLVSSTYLPSSTTGVWTPDGHQLPVDPRTGQPFDQLYSLFNNAWETAYGTPIPYQEFQMMKQAGITNRLQLEAFVNGLLSDVTGVDGKPISMGERDQIAQTANAEANKAWGRPVSNAFIKQMAQMGITNPTDIQDYIKTHAASSIPQDAYQQIYDATASYMAQSGAAMDNPDPSTVAALYQQASTLAGAPSANAAGGPSTYGDAASQDTNPFNIPHPQPGPAPSGEAVFSGR